MFDRCLSHPPQTYRIFRPVSPSKNVYIEQYAPHINTQPRIRAAQAEINTPDSDILFSLILLIEGDLISSNPHPHKFIGFAAPLLHQTKSFFFVDFYLKLTGNRRIK